ncbi:MAG: DNA polymerase III subunit delta', partial [Candidatus Hydrogenedentes bacterium]|nr:DNA polymerase III subunit delta' [Candidatus Hydrogenedentota bacterium]
MNDRTVLGQRVAMNALRASIVNDRVAHAYLFVGPDGVGKSLAAHEFAKALNCTEQTGEPCNICAVCRLIDRRTHPDVVLIEPASANRLIKTETIDQLVDAAGGSPLEAKRKVFIVIGADRMNLSAANKFLKTLEEPPGNCVFILVTSRPSVLPATVMSRCQRIKFARLPQDVIEDILVKKHAIDVGEARVAARLSNGQASRALDFVLTDRRASSMEIVRRLMNGDDPVAL